MGKRSIPSVAPKGKAKAAKTTSTPEEPKDALLPEYAPVFALIEESAHALLMPATVSEMFTAAVPHILNTPKPVRHTFQTNIVDALNKAFTEVEQLRQEALNAARYKIDETTALGSAASSKVDEANADADMKLKVHSEKKDAMKNADTALSNAKKALVDTCSSESDLAQKKKEAITAKETFEGIVGDVWKPLVDYTFIGKDWRTRDKNIDILVAALAVTDIDNSLVMSLIEVLKTKPDARGKFSLKVLECTEAAISAYVASLCEKIDNLDATKTESKDRVVEAEALVTACEQKCSSSQNEFVTAENDLLEAQVKRSKEAEALASLKLDIEAAKKEAVAASQCLDGFAEQVHKFQQLVDLDPTTKAQETEETTMVSSLEGLTTSAGAESLMEP